MFFKSFYGNFKVAFYKGGKIEQSIVSDKDSRNPIGQSRRGWTGVAQPLENDLKTMLF